MRTPFTRGARRLLVTAGALTFGLAALAPTGALAEVEAEPEPTVAISTDSVTNPAPPSTPAAPPTPPPSEPTPPPTPASGSDETQVLGATTTRTPTPQASPVQELPHTGPELALAVGGIALLAAGAGLEAAGRRRALAQIAA